MDSHIVAEIETQLKTHPVLLYMKGTPEQPMCGFSARAVQALKTCQTEFASVNILEHPDIRQTLPHYANWPTFPQLYIKGELIGGCDIIEALLASGELAQSLKSMNQN